LRAAKRREGGEKTIYKSATNYSFVFCAAPIVALDSHHPPRRPPEWNAERREDCSFSLSSRRCFSGIKGLRGDDDDDDEEGGSAKNSNEKRIDENCEASRPSPCTALHIQLFKDSRCESSLTLASLLTKGDARVVCEMQKENLARPGLSWLSLAHLARLFEARQNKNTRTSCACASDAVCRLSRLLFWLSTLSVCEPNSDEFLCNPLTCSCIARCTLCWSLEF
jgi:hypothetical protein